MYQYINPSLFISFLPIFKNPHYPQFHQSSTIGEPCWWILEYLGWFLNKCLGGLMQPGACILLDFLLTLLLIDHLKPFKISHWFCTHIVIPQEQCWQQAVLPFKSIQMVLEGPLIHHLEVSKQGFVLAVLPFGKIQTRFCIRWPTIQSHLGNQFKTIWRITVQLFHHSKPQ